MVQDITIAHPAHADNPLNGYQAFRILWCTMLGQFDLSTLRHLGDEQYLQGWEFDNGEADPEELHSLISMTKLRSLRLVLVTPFGAAYDPEATFDLRTMTTHPIHSTAVREQLPAKTSILYLVNLHPRPSDFTIEDLCNPTAERRMEMQSVFAG